MGSGKKNPAFKNLGGAHAPIAHPPLDPGMITAKYYTKCKTTTYNYIVYHDYICEDRSEIMYDQILRLLAPYTKS